MLVLEIACTLIRQRQCNLAFARIERPRFAVNHDPQIVEPGKPYMALGGKTGFGRAVFIPLERTTPEHLEQVGS